MPNTKTTGLNLLNTALSEPGFKEKLVSICNRLECKPEDMLAVMANESGIKPDAYNPNGGASGLIQFMPSIAKDLGTTTQQLRSMTRTQQLDYVYRYFAPYKGKLDSAGALYAITFLPGRFQKPMTQAMLIPGSPPLPTDSPVLASKYAVKNANYYTQNAGLDVNNDGFITVADLTEVTQKRTRQFGIVPGIVSQVTESTTPPSVLKPTIPAPSTPSVTPSTSNFNEYINKTYVIPFQEDSKVTQQVLYGSADFYRKYLNTLSNSKVNYNVDSSGNSLTIISKDDLDADIFLLDSITATQVQTEQKINTVLKDKLKDLRPDSKYMLINSELFELVPDEMRNKMSSNATKGGLHPTYSHAWRSPGKLSITADFTLPGIAGLRIGQIFWIDKISEAYKRYGAFQLFSLTETIDISRGWTTSVHARFNVLPKLLGGGEYLTEEDTDGNTANTAKNATAS